MKKIYLPLLSFTFLLIIASCSSLISKEDCGKDMQSMGLDQGKRGLNNLAENIRRVCNTDDKTVNLEAYQTGFKTGWSIFCSPINGFKMGKKGDLYKSFCPEDKEDLFREKFLIGKKVNEKNDQLSEYEDKIKELSQGGEKDLSAREELTRTEESLRSLKREIQALEQKGMSLVHTN